MKIAVLSDIHGNLPEYDFSGCELLLICGDFSPLVIQTDIPAMKVWLTNNFKQWCKNTKAKRVVFIGGNHDFIAEREDKWMHKTFPKESNIVYLKNEFIDVLTSTSSDTYRIFGTPYCKQFGNWAFMRDQETLKEKFSKIPNNVDILLSHDAPKINELGCIKDEGSQWYGEDAGNIELANAIIKAKPRYAFCGHIHSGSHELQKINDTYMANVSIVNEKYKVANEPLVLDIL